MTGKREKDRGIIIWPGEAAFEDYLNRLAQRIPRFGIKPLDSKNWRTRNRPLSDSEIRDHLEGKYYIAVLGKWYPGYAIFDIDDRSKAEAEDIRASAGLDKSNSMMYSSESENSHHIIFIPEYHDKPPTLNLLKDALKNFALVHGIEIFPQRGRPIRLPFGPHQPMLDIEYMGLDSWQKKLYWFEKLDPFNLSSVNLQQMILDFEPGPGKLLLPTNIFQEAEILLEYGLQLPSSRRHSQWLILVYLWRQNISKETAAAMVWQWLKEKHNGFSKDFLSSPEHVKKDIRGLADYVWSTYHMGQVYPDSTHNIHHGYIAKKDIPEIVEVSRGSKPRMSFLFNILKFAYPRQHRKFIPYHTDRLIKWASRRTYQKYLNELGNKGIAERGTSYVSTGFAGLRGFSKDLKLNWKFKSSSEAILYDGRSVETFDDVVRLSFKDRPDEFRQLLIKTGVEQSAASKQINSIWRKD